MAVAGGHYDRLVACGLLDVLGRRAGHREPGAERMPIAVPQVSVLTNTRFLSMEDITRCDRGPRAEKLLPLLRRSRFRNVA